MTGERRSRSYGDILRANLLTRFNALLGSLALLLIVLGRPGDALFGLIVVANALVGIGQEFRAKWTLDRLQVWAEPHPRWSGDRLLLARGERAAADGRLVVSDGLEMDESLITGESAPLAKRPGDEILSGSFVVAGSGEVEVTASGGSSYAARLAAEARAFKLATSELRSGINRFVRVIGWVLPFAAAILVVSELRIRSDFVDAVRRAVAGVVTLVPEGLVLLTSVAMATAVVRLGRRRVLVQDLAAVEVLARVDAVVMDKTGTLTDGSVVFERLDVVSGARESVEAGTAALAAIEAPTSSSLKAVATALPAPDWVLQSHTPFSSTRGWSEATFDGQGTWRIGAPERMGLEHPLVEQLQSAGARVLGVCHDGKAVALAVLRERVRAQAASAIEGLRAQGASLWIASGDAQATALAIAKTVGVPADHVLGRVRPEDKRQLVERLRAGGHTVGMIGDGVNDVAALKAADIGIAVGSGSAATRAIAQLVLVEGDLSALADVIAEGRRVIANTERLSTLYFTKTVYALALLLAVGLAGDPFPFFPRHLTLVAVFTIGIPSVFLALAPNTTRARPGFLRRALLVSVPAGLAAGAATYLAYWLALEEPGATQIVASTLATLVLAVVGIWFLSIIVRPWTTARRALIALMVVGVVIAAGLPAGRDVFELQVPSPVLLLAGVGVVAITGTMMELIAAARRPASTPQPT